MDVLGNGGWFWWNLSSRERRLRSRKQAKASESVDSDSLGEFAIGGRRGFNFPLKHAATAGSLVLTGDTIAQIRDRYNKQTALVPENKDVMLAVLSDHDWLRALRMASYGFLLYGPGSYAWYELLDYYLPAQTFRNLSLKVTLNQVVLGPMVIAVIFAWNSLWQGKLSELPSMYQKNALPSLIYGFKFWIPATIVNFWAIPLDARVAYMSTCAIFWNFYLSSTMSK